MRTLLEQQQRLIAAQSQQIETLRQRLDQIIAADSARVKGVGDASEQAVPRQPELPEKVVTAGEFAGSIGIPGTNA